MHILWQQENQAGIEITKDILEVKGLFNSSLLFFLSLQKEIKVELKYSYI